VLTLFLSLQNETTGTAHNPTEILLSSKEQFATADKQVVLLNKGEV